MALANSAPLHTPLGLLAELTHRCPLGCPYCSNPLALDPRENRLKGTRLDLDATPCLLAPFGVVIT